MKKLVNTSKIWLISTIIIICLGVIFLSVFGFNNTADYSKGYQITVGLDQTDSSLDKVYETAETYFDEIGAKTLKYSKVYVNDGNSIIYSFNDLVEFNREELVDRIDAVVDNTFVDIIVEGKVTQSSVDFDAKGVLLALAISAIVIFVLSIIFVKIKMAITNFMVGILSALTYVSMSALFRIPVLNLLGVFVALAFVLGTILSSISLIKYNSFKKLSDNEKLSAVEIIKINYKDYSMFHGIAFSILMLISIALLIFGMGYLRFIALNVIIVAIASVSFNYVAVPTIWSFLDKNNKNN